MGSSEELEALHKLKDLGYFLNIEYFNGEGSPVRIKALYRGVVTGRGYGESLTDALFDLLFSTGATLVEILDKEENERQSSQGY